MKQGVIRFIYLSEVTGLTMMRIRTENGDEKYERSEIDRLSALSARPANGESPSIRVSTLLSPFAPNRTQLPLWSLLSLSLSTIPGRFAGSQLSRESSAGKRSA